MVGCVLQMKLNPDGRWVPATYNEIVIMIGDQPQVKMCGKSVRQYRSCGAGAAVKCGHVLAYCDEHGGDERAAREMSKHHEDHRV